MRSIHILSLFALSVPFAGCASDPSPAEVELDTARQKFDDQMPSNAYSFRWQRACECTSDTTAPIRIEVVNGVISAAFYIETELAVPAEVRQYLWTIEGIFDEIDSALDDAHQVTVEYDANLGFPKSVAVDYDAQIADEELSLRISEVVSIGR